METAVSLQGVSKRFAKVLALDDVDLEVAAGTVFGLLGPNGAGKTTAVRVLTTIIPPDAGSARVLGRDVVSEADEVRAHIGLAGQYAAVDENLTGRENLRLIGRLTHLERGQVTRRAGELLERFELSGAADRPARTYSGGMRRRLDLAAALVHEPPVLFLDEPTTGLDPRSRAELWKLIRELVDEGTTLMLTTQYLEEADRLCDRISVIDEGRVIAEGTAAELKARLGATVIEVGFSGDDEAVRAQPLFARLGTGDAQREGSVVRLEVSEGPRALMNVLGALDRQGIVPATVALREPSLDDVFFALTGHPAEPARADGADLVGAEEGSQ
ncbi:MAG: ATP-binding cassette domain-containing protein [Actinomycetota bacterium]|nr:ATP-binding cassette domain-containing protein [Actinomycetota bacterium]MDQ3679674.1 ATP-binding cassette domain-containing protein [Actinomycetota bacterium]